MRAVGCGPCADPGGSPIASNTVYGRHDGFRRNHAKGLSATGTFASNGAGAAICRATVFQPGKSRDWSVLVGRRVCRISPTSPTPSVVWV